MVYNNRVQTLERVNKKYYYNVRKCVIINILCYHTIMKMERAIRRIVVTGATSTVGVAVINEALEKGIEVLAICSQNCTKLDRLPQNSLLTIVECDISKYSTLNVNNTKKYDAFFHLAWLAGWNIWRLPQ